LEVIGTVGLLRFLVGSNGGGGDDVRFLGGRQQGGLVQTVLSVTSAGGGDGGCNELGGGCRGAMGGCEAYATSEEAASQAVVDATAEGTAGSQAGAGRGETEGMQCAQLRGCGTAIAQPCAAPGAAPWSARAGVGECSGGISESCGTAIVQSSAAPGAATRSACAGVGECSSGISESCGTAIVQSSAAPGAATRSAGSGVGIGVADTGATLEHLAEQRGLHDKDGWAPVAGRRRDRARKRSGGGQAAESTAESQSTSEVSHPRASSLIASVGTTPGVCASSREENGHGSGVRVGAKATARGGGGSHVATRPPAEPGRRYGGGIGGVGLGSSAQSSPASLARSSPRGSGGDIEIWGAEQRQQMQQEGCATALALKNTFIDVIHTPIRQPRTRSAPPSSEGAGMGRLYSPVPSFPGVTGPVHFVLSDGEGDDEDVSAGALLSGGQCDAGDDATATGDCGAMGMSKPVVLGAGVSAALLPRPPEPRKDAVGDSPFGSVGLSELLIVAVELLEHKWQAGDPRLQRVHVLEDCWRKYVDAGLRSSPGSSSLQRDIRAEVLEIMRAAG